MIFILSFAFLLISFVCVVLAYAMDFFFHAQYGRSLLPSWIIPKSLR